MTTGIREIQALADHPFSKQVWAVARPFIPAPEAPHKSDEELAEHEFYAISCGYSLAHLLTVCGQLVHLRYYLTGFVLPASLRRAGATRAEQLVLAVEDFVIRSQSLYDRALALVNSVFHLGNAVDTITHAVIVGNSHIQSAPAVLVPLKSLRKLVSQYQDARNSIIHRATIQADDLRQIEILEILSRENDPAFPPKGLAATKARLVREACRSRTEEFSSFTTKAFHYSAALFDVLAPEHLRRFQTIRAACTAAPPKPSGPKAANRADLSTKVYIGASLR